jgi:hypothetical protein
MSSENARTVKLKKAMWYADAYDLDRQERLELSEMILRRDVESWKSLTEEELVRVLDALEGFGLISHLRNQTRA